MNTTEPLEIVHIKVQSKTDGIYVSSDDVPGLWLWGDPDHVFENIIPCIKALYQENRKLTVEVREAPRSRNDRWSGSERMTDTFEIYQVASNEEENSDGRRTVE